MDEKKVREAIKMLRREKKNCKELLDLYENVYCDSGLLEKKIEGLGTAIEALEKQLAKKPIKHETKYAPIFECPSCGCVDVYRQKNCDECGQKLDWSE